MFVEEDFTLEHAINVKDELACSIDMLLPRHKTLSSLDIDKCGVPFARAIGGLEMRNS